MEVETTKSNIGMSWKTVRLGEIFEIARGGSPRPIESFLTNDENGVNWIMIGDTKDSGKYIEKTAKKIKREGVFNSRMVNEGDFLLTNSMSFGRPYILKTSGCIHDGWLVLSPKDENIHRDYFYYYLGSDEIKQSLSSKAAGAVVKNLNKEIVSDLVIELPPLATQKRIAEILDAADALRRKDQELLKKYDELAQAIFIDMFGDPVKNEKGISLSELIKINPVKSELNTEGNFEVTFIPMSNVGENGEFDNSLRKLYSEVKNGFTYFKENDVLFAKITPCMENGKGAIAKELVNSIGFGSTEFHVLRPNATLKSSFIYHLTMLDSFRSFAEANMTGSAGQKRVPTNFFSKIKIDKEKITNQDAFENGVNMIAKAKLIAQKNYQKSNILFDSLIQKAFKGELV